MLSRLPALTLAVLAGLAACARDPSSPAPVTSVVSIVPDGGAAGVDPTAPIVITFSHPMAMGMEAYAALHQSDVTGPAVAGTWTWSADQITLSFSPAQPLMPATGYALHLGGGMHDAVGGDLDYQQCVSQHGGQWVTGAMMGGGGMIGDATMMGPGWRHANGSYGMVFTFTTA